MPLLDKMIITFTVNLTDQVQIPVDADQRRWFLPEFSQGCSSQLLSSIPREQRMYHEKVPTVTFTHIYDCF